MNTFIGTIAGILFGGILTFIASKYFYKKSIKIKKLSCFVQYVSEILTDIEPDLKKQLLVKYNGQIVDSLHQVQFIIANTGDRPISNLIKPLTLCVPNKAEVLDASIVHIEPNGRELSLTNIIEKCKLEFNFPLLNSGEYFVVKLLIKGEVPEPIVEINNKNRDKGTEFDEFRKYNLYKFTISIDDLPPVLISERLPLDYFDFETRSFSTISLRVGTIIATFSLIFGYILFNLKYLKPDLFLFNFKLFFNEISPLKACILLGWLTILIFAIMAPFILLEESSLFKPKKKTKFRLPIKLSDTRQK